MTQIDIQIMTNNSAFQMETDDGEKYAPGQEAARILREAADAIEDYVPAGLNLSDYNGRKVGTLTHKDNDRAVYSPNDDQRRVAYLEAKLEDMEKENSRIKGKLAQAHSDLAEWLS